MTPEKKVQNAILHYLKDLSEAGYPVMFDRRQAGGFSYKMGIPDVWASIDGRHIEIECKRFDGGELSSMQEKFKKKCKLANIPYIEAHSLEDVINVIQKILNIS